MVIKNANTIAQYKILRWMDENFFPSSVTAEFTERDTAIITDRTGDSMEVAYDTVADQVIEVKE